jgi:hypothetical protein
VQRDLASQKITNVKQQTKRRNDLASQRSLASQSGGGAERLSESKITNVTERRRSGET